MITPQFSVIGGDAISQFISTHPKQIKHIIKETYQSHQQGQTINPDSYFLRFDDPLNRIIALPASLKENNVSGIKWISSYPRNTTMGIPRASAVLILNDGETGYPFVCMESSLISATRTASSAVLAAEYLNGKEKTAKSIGFIGCGLISEYIYRHFQGNDWDVEQINLFDSKKENAINFSAKINSIAERKTVIEDSIDTLFENSDIIVLATTAGKPYIMSLPESNRKIILHLSLRDLSVDIIKKAINVTDDIEHAMKANTSLHLTEQKVKSRDFIHCTLADLFEGEITLPNDERNVIFSPFGLGVLDIALGYYIYQHLNNTEQSHSVKNFFVI